MKKKLLVTFLLLLAVLLMAACGDTSTASSAPSDSSQATENDTGVLTIIAPEETMFVEDVMHLKAEDGRKVLWSSSDETVATVDADGSVKALSAGEVTITASLAKNESVKAEHKILIGEHVQSISLVDSGLTLLTGSKNDTATIQVDIQPETALCRDFSYVSSDPSIATVDESGAVHAVAKGSTTITVKSLDNACQTELSCDVIVKQGVSSITLNETQKELNLKNSLALTATVLPEDADDRTYTWSSTDESVVKVNSNGAVTPVGAGEAKILCTANDGGGTTGFCDVRVVVGVDKVTLDSKAVQVLIGAGSDVVQKIGYTLTPERNSYPDLIWSSSDESVVKVDSDGVLRGVAPGKAVITAVSTDPNTAGRVKATCAVTVGNAVASINTDWGDETIAKGAARKVAASVFPSDAINPKLAWTTSNDKVLTVDAKGSVRAVGVGKATITCTTTDGTNISESKEYTVIQAVTGVTATERGVIVIFSGNSKQLHVAIKPDDASVKDVVWESNDSSIAFVDSTGKVFAKNAGTTFITATATDGSGKSCRFNVVVEPTLPITIESLGFGVYNGNLLGITVRNYCSRTTIKNFDFTIALYMYDGTQLSTSGSYNLGKDETIGPDRTRTIKRTLSGVAWAQKVVISITGVKLADGTYYSIPSAYQEVWTFTRR